MTEKKGFPFLRRRKACIKVYGRTDRKDSEHTVTQTAACREGIWCSSHLAWWIVAQGRGRLTRQGCLVVQGGQDIWAGRQQHEDPETDLHGQGIRFGEQQARRQCRFQREIWHRRTNIGKGTGGKVPPTSCRGKMFFIGLYKAFTFSFKKCFLSLSKEQAGGVEVNLISQQPHQTML